MPRSIWNGAISFGLVNVPVQLFSATEEKDVHFNQFQKDTGKRIHNKRVAEGSDEEVPFSDIVKGYEVDDGRYVIVTPEELESVEPGKSRTIDIEDFVDLEDIDPVYFKTTYYIGPQEGAGADKAYALLRAAMERSGKIAIGRFVMRTKQYLVALRTSGNLLVLETMYFPDEIRDPKNLGVKGDGGLGEKELKIADQLVRSLSSGWEPTKYKDTYRERVLDLIKRKAKGEDVVVERPKEEEADVVDLMAALEASLAAARAPATKTTKKKAGGAEKASAAKKTTKKKAAKKAAARKAS